MTSASGQVAGCAVRRTLLVTAAALSLAGILTGCDATATFHGDSSAPPAASGAPAAASSGPAAAADGIAAPAPITATNWTPVACDNAVGWLKQDAQLDRAAAAKPMDPRWPSATPAYYLGLASQWDAIVKLLEVDCGRSAGQPGQAGIPTCSDAIAWLTQARVNHEADQQRAGITDYEKQWNNDWAAFYNSLSATLQPGCGVG